MLSLQIDTWTHEQLLHMRTLGNAAVNAELEAALPSFSQLVEGMPAVIKPDQATCTTAELEAYIRAKYEHGSFRLGGNGWLPHVVEGATTKAMDEFVGLLIIRLIRAENLPKMDTLGKTDAFCEFTLGGRKATSKVIRSSLSPTWNQTLSLNVRSLSETLILKVLALDSRSRAWTHGRERVPTCSRMHAVALACRPVPPFTCQVLDAERFGSPEFIGQALVPLQDLTHDGQPMGFDLTIQQPDGRKGRSGRASVAVELTYNPLNLG